MKKAFVSLIIIFAFQNLFSQSFNEESYKYWYYRDRLKYFVYPSDEEGGSILMTSRNSTGSGGPYFQFNGAEWGQTRKINGYYIGLLATEYQLLKENGQYSDAISTLHELDLALDALIRMDKCEDLEPWNFPAGFNNGFFIRNDVPPVLTSAMVDYLNNDLSVGDFWAFVAQYSDRPGLPFSIAPEVVLCSRKYGSSLNYFYTNYDPSEFDLSDYLAEGNSYWSYWKSDKFTSNDEIIGTLMGLSLVAACVDNNAVKNKAIEIAQTLRFFARGYDPLQPYQMFYPDGEKIKFSNGGNSLAVYNGIDNSVRKMEGVPNPSFDGYPAYIYTVIYNATGWPAPMNRGMYCKLLATSNYPVPMHNYVYIKWLGQSENWHTFYLLLWAVINDKDLEKNKYQYPFDLLIDDLQTAPCSGPYKHSDNNPRIISEGWACEYKYDASLSGQQVGGDRTGVFPGADYMLLYNLACLAFPDGFDYNGQHYSFPYYVNQNNRKANGEYYPVIFTPPMLGSQIERGSFEFPEEIRAISTINSNMVVSNKALLLPSGNYLPKKFGDVTLKASESIKLTDGFRVDKGAHFLARIESYSCGGQSYKNIEAPPWDENYRGCFYDTLASIPMDKRAPIVYSEDDYSVDDFDTPLWDDYYYTYDTTSNPELEVGVWLNPNPCQNSSTLTLVSENDTYITIELFDMGGQKRATIFEGQSGTSGFDLSIDMSPYAKGMYVVRITGDGGTKVLKIVKE